MGYISKFISGRHRTGFE